MDNNEEIVDVIDIDLSPDSFLALKRFIDSVYNDMHTSFDGNDNTDFYLPKLKDTAKDHMISLTVSNYNNGNIKVVFSHNNKDVRQTITSRLMSKRKEEDTNEC